MCCGGSSAWKASPFPEYGSGIFNAGGAGPRAGPVQMRRNERSGELPLLRSTAATTKYMASSPSTRTGFPRSDASRGLMAISAPISSARSSPLMAGPGQLLKKLDRRLQERPSSEDLWTPKLVFTTRCRSTSLLAAPGRPRGQLHHGAGLNPMPRPPENGHRTSSSCAPPAKPTSSPSGRLAVYTKVGAGRQRPSDQRRLPSPPSSTSWAIEGIRLARCFDGPKRRAERGRAASCSGPRPIGSFCEVERRRRLKRWARAIRFEAGRAPSPFSSPAHARIRGQGPRLGPSPRCCTKKARRSPFFPSKRPPLLQQGGPCDERDRPGGGPPAARNRIMARAGAGHRREGEKVVRPAASR